MGSWGKIQAPKKQQELWFLKSELQNTLEIVKVKNTFKLYKNKLQMCEVGSNKCDNTILLTLSNSTQYTMGHYTVKKKS